MALNQRERILAWGAGSLLSLALVQFGYNWVQSLFEARQTQIDALKRDIADKNAAVLRGKKAIKKLAGWQHRSLPSDPVLARSLYKNWLARLVERTRLAKADVSLGADMPKPGIYVKVPVTLRGQGTMEQVVQFLFDFYQADHLHYIRQLTLTPIAGSESPGGPSPGGGPPIAAPAPGPVPPPGGFGGPGGFGLGGPNAGGQKYEIVMGIEALILPGADHRDQLSDAKAERLAFNDAESYRKTITERNFFSPYRRIVEADPAADTYVTAVVKKEGKYQVWINLRSSGKMLKLHEGETFDLGKEKATVSRIEPHSVEIEVGGRQRLVTLGKNLVEERGRRGGFGRRGFPGPMESLPE